MTTLMMPSEYGVEMYLGSSPVLTSYLSTQSFLDYPRLAPPPACQPQPTTTIGLHSIWDPQPSSYSSGFGGGCRANLVEGGVGGSCSSEYNSGLATRDSIRRRARSRRSPPKKSEATPALLQLQPTKSCLVARPEEEYEDSPLSPTRLKKRVVFADDQGHPLIEVRLLTERPDSPPRWSADFLEQVTGGAKAEACDQWEIAFAQPAADYLAMRAKLEENNVSLENVLVKEAESRVTGTVKVRNLSYQKRVKVRYTTSNWLKHEDVHAEYVPPPLTTTNTYDLYDTFSFVLPLPSSSQADKLEFCVCFTADYLEYWDNNNNQNYVIVSFRSKNRQQTASKPNDVYRCSLDSWSEFASWNHLSLDDSPYW